MTDTEWVRRCADRLHEQWPRASREDLEETARELHAQDHWRGQPAEEAAVTCCGWACWFTRSLIVCRQKQSSAEAHA